MSPRLRQTHVNVPGLLSYHPAPHVFPLCLNYVPNVFCHWFPLFSPLLPMCSFFVVSNDFPMASNDPLVVLHVFSITRYFPNGFSAPWFPMFSPWLPMPYVLMVSLFVLHVLCLCLKI